MGDRKKSFISALTIAVLLGAEAGLVPGAVRAHPSPEIPARLSQFRPWQKSYDCGNSLVTLNRQGNSDRYIYHGTNARGQTLTLRNGVRSSKASSSVYTFIDRDRTRFVVEDFYNGRATLTTSNYPNVGATTFDCVAIKSDGSPEPNPSPSRWSHTYQCGEYAITLREEDRNLYSYRTRDLYLRNGERQNTGRSWLYSFYNNDYAYRVEDVWGGGPATLTVTHYGRTILSRNCRK